MAETYQSEIVASNSPALALRHTAALEAVLHVVDDSHPRKHAILLKHDSTFRTRFGNEGVSDSNGAIRRQNESRNHLQQGAFATAGGTNEAHKLPLRNLKRYVCDGTH